jgi:Mg2+-importing ATPase
MLETSREGITDEMAKERQQKFGLNEVKHQKALKWYVQLLKSFANPFIYILLLIATVSFIIDVGLPEVGERDYKTVVVVSIMILVSALLRFVQEYRSTPRQKN